MRGLQLFATTEVQYGFSYGISNLDRYMLRMAYRKREYLSYISKESGIKIDELDVPFRG